MIFTVKKIYSILIGLIIVSNFQGCLAVYDSLDSKKHPSLPDNTPFILSFLNYSPQGISVHHQQVWVGYLHYQQDTDYTGIGGTPPDLIPGVWWPNISGEISNFLWFLNLYYRYDENAIVEIASYNNSINSYSRVTLTYEGNGVYGDVNNELKIEPDKTYRLLIQLSDGREYSAITDIPKFEWTPPDTFYVQPYLNQKDNGEYEEISPSDPSFIPSRIPNGNTIAALNGYPDGIEMMEGKTVLASALQGNISSISQSPLYLSRGLEWGPFGLTGIRAYNYPYTDSTHFLEFWYRYRPSNRYKLPAVYYYCDAMIIRLSAYNREVTAHGDGRGWWLHGSYPVILGSVNVDEDAALINQINRFHDPGDNAKFFIGSTNLLRRNPPTKKHPFIIKNTDAIGIFAGVTNYYARIPIIPIRDGYDPVSIGWLTEEQSAPYRNRSQCIENIENQLPE